jgi:hypothetical protein
LAERESTAHKETKQLQQSKNLVARQTRQSGKEEVGEENRIVGVDTLHSL